MGAYLHTDFACQAVLFELYRPILYLDKAFCSHYGPPKRPCSRSARSPDVRPPQTMMKKPMIFKSLLCGLFSCALLSVALPAHAQTRLSLKNSESVVSEDPNKADPRYRWKDGINTAELSELIQKQHQNRKYKNYS